MGVSISTIEDDEIWKVMSGREKGKGRRVCVCVIVAVYTFRQTPSNAQVEGAQERKRISSHAHVGGVYSRATI